MKVVVVGAGGAGGLLGALLARSGSEVAFVARGEQLRALQGRGLRVTTPLGSFHTGPLAAAAEPAQLGQADLVLVAVKTWQVRAMAPRLKPLLREGTLVVPVQNGVEAADELGEALGEGAVLGAALHVLSRVEAPGAVLHEGGAPRITFGARASSRVPAERLAALCEAFRLAGVDAQIADDIDAVLWEKLLFVEPLGSVGAVARAEVGALRGIPETRALLVAAMEEIAAVARGRKSGIAADAVARALARVDKMPPGSSTSMSRDIAEGRPSELQEQTGAVVRVGRLCGVQTRVHDFLLAALLPQEKRARAGDVGARNA
ncbi:MAG: 2-dehydropantoate 2-reductase [Myxococcales bacterium]